MPSPPSPRAALRCRRRSRRPCPRAARRPHVVMPISAPTAAGGGGVVAGQQHGAEAERLRCGGRRARASASTCRRRRTAPRTVVAHCDEHGRSGRRVPRAAPRAVPGTPPPRSASRLGRPASTSWPSTMPRRRGRLAPRSLDRGSEPIRRAAAAAIARATGCSDHVLERARQREQLSRARGRREQPDVVHRDVAGRDGAGLVEDDRVDAGGTPPGLLPLDEDAELRAPARADEERGRRRQAEAQGRR